MIRTMVVEGRRDAELLNALFGGKPVIEQGDSKQSLIHTAKRIKKSEEWLTAYIRDRDFDYVPPSDRSRPFRDPKTLHHRDEGVYGFCWCRHEIENYLADPAIVEKAHPHIIRVAYEDALTAVAESIRFYEAARWAVGSSRALLPAQYKLNTEPDSVHDKLALPEDLSEPASRQWAVKATGEHFDKVENAIGQIRIEDAFHKYCSQFSKEFRMNIEEVLMWFSGKDLFAGLAEWAEQHEFQGAGDFLSRTRNWCRFNPDEAAELLPEWTALREIVKDPDAHA